MSYRYIQMIHRLVVQCVLKFVQWYSHTIHSTIGKNDIVVQCAYSYIQIIFCYETFITFKGSYGTFENL